MLCTNLILSLQFYSEVLIILQKEYPTTELVTEVILLGKNLGLWCLSWSVYNYIFHFFFFFVQSLYLINTQIQPFDQNEKLWKVLKYCK